MSGPATLLATLATLYVIECIVIIRGGQVAFRGTLRGGWCVVRGGLSIGGAGARIVLLPLLPWMRGMLVTSWSGDGRPVRPGEIRARSAALDQATIALRIDALAMAVMVFLAGPLAVRLVGWTVAWPLLLAGVLVIALLIVGDFRAAASAVEPGATRGSRMPALVTFALSPAAAMRAEDVLLRSALAGHSALAVAHVLCTREEFERLAAEWIRSRRRGEAVVGAAVGPGSGHGPERTAMEEFIATVAPELLRTGAAPRRQDPDARSYCPSCACEFAIMEGACEACGGVALERFEDASQRVVSAR